MIYGKIEGSSNKLTFDPLREKCWLSIWILCTIVSFGLKVVKKIRGKKYDNYEQKSSTNLLENLDDLSKSCKRWNSDFWWKVLPTIQFYSIKHIS